MKWNSYNEGAIPRGINTHRGIFTAGALHVFLITAAQASRHLVTLISPVELHSVRNIFLTTICGYKYQWHLDHSQGVSIVQRCGGAILNV